MNKQTQHYALKLFFCLGLVFSFSVYSQAQPVKKKNCKVKIKELEGEYDGYCLKGLAHGEGVAEGEHTYKGEFKKGLPHGHGTYSYSDGSRYEGEFKNGQRNGKGKMYKLGQKPLYALWKNDAMQRELYEQEHKVVIARNVNSVRCRVQDTRKNRIEYHMGGDANIEEVDIVAQSGLVFQDGRIIRLEDVIFPEKVRMTYKSWNKMMTRQNQVIIDIQFESPGNWRVDVTNM